MGFIYFPINHIVCALVKVSEIQFAMLKAENKCFELTFNPRNTSSWNCSI